MIDYSLIRHTDSPFEQGRPVGVVWWSPRDRAIRSRILREDERPRLSPRRLVDHAVKLLKSYVESGSVPYHAGPKDDPAELLKAATELFGPHSIRFDKPKQADVKDEDLGMELLFEACVQPERAEEEEHLRIDSFLSRALGKTSPLFKSRATVSGFDRRPVPVKKLAESLNFTIVIDAVNLAARDAERNLEAMLLRGSEITEHAPAMHKEVKLMLGYLESPGGLNGEAKLIEYGKSKGLPLVSLGDHNLEQWADRYLRN